MIRAALGGFALMVSGGGLAGDPHAGVAWATVYVLSGVIGMLTVTGMSR